jgi:transposase-like protein
MKEDFPKNEVEFDRRFHSEQACLEYLFQLRWPEGFVCPKCGHTDYWKSSRGLYLCKRCEHHQSVIAGTIFHSTRKPLTIWFKALWWFSTRKSGVNATTLQQMLGFGSYQTAWRWLQKFRTCTIFPTREMLSGHIEADEVYLGGAHSGKRGRGAGSKCKASVAVERQGRKLGRLRIQVIENCSGAELISFAKKNIATGSRVTTDGWKGYNGLEQAGYVHQKVLQAQVEDKASVLPGVHLVASLVNRVLLGTFHGRFGQKYLQRYLDEYVFRFNRRTTKSVGKRFWRIIQRAVATAPITNKDLTQMHAYCQAST